MNPSGSALFTNESVSSDRQIYTANTFAKNSLLYLQEIGHLKALKVHKSERTNLDSFLFFIVESGDGSLMYDGRLYELTSGSIVFIDCNKLYYHKSSNNLWKLRWIHFNGQVMKDIYSKYVERGGEPAFNTDNTESFIRVWDELFLVAKSDDYIKDMHINQSLSALLSLLMEHSWKPDNQRKDTKLQDLAKIKNFLDENYVSRISLDELASHFFINKFYMARIFKKEYGVSINNYILQKRITYAKQLLRFSSMSIEEIGQSCGIGALYYFSRIFKQVEGISPSEYRKRW